jgi:16S rRNA processing protein RimM
MADEFVYPVDRYLLIGKIIKPHGIRGALKIYSYSEQPENMLRYKELVIVDKNGQRTNSLGVKKCCIQGKTAIVTLASIDNRNKAEELQGNGVLLDKKDLPKTRNDEFYWFQLHGLSVETKSGKQLGKVIRIFSNGAQDIMIIGNHHQEYMVPILKEIIVAQDQEKITIAPPPGLLEINFKNGA